MKTTRLLFAALLCSAMFATAASAAPRKYHWTFEKSIGMSYYPRSMKAQFSIVPDAFAGKGALQIVNPGNKSPLVYGWAETRQAAGKLEIEFQQKMLADGEVTVTLYFNKKGGRQGSAGRKNLKFAGSKTWKQEKFSVPVTAEVNAVQVLISMSKNANTLWLDDVKFTFTPDAPAAAPAAAAEGK